MWDLETLRKLNEKREIFLREQKAKEEQRAAAEREKEKQSA